MSQLAYADQADRAFAGLLGDSNVIDTLSRANEEAVDLEFGIGVMAGTVADVEALLPTTGNALLGVVIHRHQEDRSLAADDGVPADGGNMELLTKGSIWVHIDQDVAVGDPVFMRIAAGNQGWFRMDADTANAEAVPGARWERGGTAAEGLALLEVNLPA